MPNGTRAALAAACIVGWASHGARLAAQRGGTRADSDAVAALEHRWLSSAYDSATLEQILAPDFVHAVSTGDIIDKREHIAFVVAHPAPASVRRRFGRLDVRVYGTTAIATGIVDQSRDGTSGVRHTVFTDVFLKRSGRWQAVSAQETDVGHP